MADIVETAERAPAAPATDPPTRPRPFSKSFSSDAAPLLFLNSRINEIEKAAKSGSVTPDDALWMVQQIRDRLGEVVHIENRIHRTIAALDDIMRGAV